MVSKRYREGIKKVSNIFPKGFQKCQKDDKRYPTVLQEDYDYDHYFDYGFDYDFGYDYDFVVDIDYEYDFKEIL